MRGQAVRPAPDPDPEPHAEPTVPRDCNLQVAGETHGSVSYPFVHRAFEWLKPQWQRLEEQ